MRREKGNEGGWSLPSGPSRVIVRAFILLAFGLPEIRAAGEDVRSPPPEGVTPAVEGSIEKGFQYLLGNENGDGSWDASPFLSGYYTCATTGLVGLAFLAHGDTPTRGPHADVVRRITDFLLASRNPNGLITQPGDQRSMYGHAFAITFLAQVFGQEGDPARREVIREVLNGAIRLTANSQTDDGGWGYYPNYNDDEGTLTVTQLQSLRACRDAGIFVPKDIIDKGVKYIEKSSLDDGRVRYRARPGGRFYARPGVACAAIVALWNAGQYDSPILRRTKDYVNRNISFVWSDGNTEHAEYVAYYLSQAKWVLGGKDRPSYKDWLNYYRSASQQLVQSQERDGHWERGSDARRYGSTYGTAVALIILQLPYNRLPVYQR